MLRRRTREGRQRLVSCRGHPGRGLWGRRCVLGGGLLAEVEEGYAGLGVERVGDALCCAVDQKGWHVWLAVGGGGG